jgi:hypothetical protein
MVYLLQAQTREALLGLAIVALGLAVYAVARRFNPAFTRRGLGDCPMTALAHRFASGVEGVPFTVPSANPESYQAVLRDGEDCLARRPVTLQGLLFPQAEPAPLVLVVPGSVGVAKSHRAHAETLHGAGYATAVLDPFGGRAVASTVANQTQYTFAASAFDVCRAAALLAQRPEVQGRAGGRAGA